MFFALLLPVLYLIAFAGKLVHHKPQPLLASLQFLLQQYIQVVKPLHFAACLGLILLHQLLETLISVIQLLLLGL